MQQRVMAVMLLLLAVVFGPLPHTSHAQNVPDEAFVSDSLSLDSLSTDSLSTDSLKNKNRSGLTAVVNYKATDSLVFSMGNMAYLYGQSEVTYDDINLTAERIQLSLDSSLVHANGIRDTSSENPNALIGAPVFKDKSGEYETKTISYNFKTAKGYITDVVTQQGDGYVTGGVTKKMPDNDIFLENGRYTTCDYHECPHFYINLTKARVRPGKNIVTGPAYLVVADVPLPLAIPFGFFPFTKSYSSGFIMPTYGSDMSQGLYLRDGGWYFAINDYMDLALKGSIYTKGTWGVNGATKYAVRYKYNGNVTMSYLYSVTGEKGMPDFSARKDFKVRWQHSQDAHYNPNLTLMASVDYSTTGYDRNNIAGYYTNDMTTSNKQSSVNLSYKIPNTKWSFNSNFSIGQNMQDSTLNVVLPELSVSMSRIYPFKRKTKVGADRWYEKITLDYKGRFSNKIRARQDEILKKSLVKDWSNGAQHTLHTDAAFTVLRYITISPSFDFADRMYTSSVKQRWDETIENPNGTFGGVARDTTYGFYNSYDYSVALSASTTLYGMYKPAPFFKNAKLVAVRHLFKPNLSLSYNPDFTKPRYGTWGTYSKPDENAPDGYSDVQYSYFSGGSFPPTSKRLSGTLHFSVDNNLEAKIRSDQDSTGYKKISLIDKLSTGLSYNMAADSMKWSQTSLVNMTIKPGKNTTMNFSGTFDNYEYEISPNGKSLYHVDRFRMWHGKMPRLMNTSYSYSFSLNNQKVAKWFGFGDAGDSNESSDEEDNGFEEIDPTADPTDPVYRREKEREREEKAKGRFKGKGGFDGDGYLIWEIPWTMNISYSMQYTYNRQDIDFRRKEYRRHIVHTASVSGTINPTKSWDFGYNFTYDFNAKKVPYLNFNVSRDMHCWTLRASMSPIGQFAHFNVCIAVKSTMLSDLKYEKSSVSRSNKIDWYDD